MQDFRTTTFARAFLPRGFPAGMSDIPDGYGPLEFDAMVRIM